MAEKLMGLKELSEQIGVSMNTLYDWCAVGKIPHIKLGKFLKFDPLDIEKWLQEKKIKTRE